MQNYIIGTTCHYYFIIIPPNEIFVYYIPIVEENNKLKLKQIKKFSFLWLDVMENKTQIIINGLFYILISWFNMFLKD